jgi:N utilization substance protein B
MTTRRQARCLTLEVLYEADIANHSPHDVMERRLLEQDLDAGGVKFANKLMDGVLKFQKAMDNLISRYAPEWPLDQMAVVDRNILRIAIFEFLIDDETPVKVAINEAVELAKVYGSDSAPRFVNGVLGSLAEQIPQLRQEIEIASEAT